MALYLCCTNVMLSLQFLSGSVMAESKHSKEFLFKTFYLSLLITLSQKSVDK